MEVKILGSGCSKCRALEANTRQALRDLGIEAEVVKETEVRNIVAYGVLSTPGLVVDGKVEAAGRVPGVGEIKDILSRLRDAPEVR